MREHRPCERKEAKKLKQKKTWKRRRVLEQNTCESSASHSVSAHTVSLQPRVDSSSGEDENEVSQVPVPTVTTSVAAA